MDRKRFIPLASLGLATAEFAAACSGNNPGGKVLSQELDQKVAEDGRTFTSVIVESDDPSKKAELDQNKGLNVRIDDNIDGLGQGTIIGKIKTGTAVYDIVLFDSGNGNLIASRCDNPAINLDENFRSFLEETGHLDSALCYFDADYTEEIK